MRRLSIPLLVCLFSNWRLVHAQSNNSLLPVEIGGRSSIAWTRFNKFTPPASPGLQVGVMVGAFARISLLPWLALQPELLYETKGSKVLFDGDERGSYSLSYLSLPILIRGERPVMPLVDAFALVGPALSTPLSSEVEDVNGIRDIMDSTNKIDLGLIVGMGVSVDVMKNITITIDARYELGLLDVLDTGNDTTTTNRTFSLTVGAAWSKGKDSDRDGIVNYFDACWRRAEDVDKFQDDDGCPDPDNDEDGIPDKQDECPGDAEDIDKFQDEDGCPDPDNDGDLVLDVDDKCPNEPFDTGDGCPPTYQWIKLSDDNRIELATPFDSFEVKKAELSESHKKILADIVKLLRDYPDMRLRIKGHADGEGNKADNETYSQRRADAVRDYLKEQGIAPERLVAKGYGEDHPVRQEDTEEGKEKNRRVEFEIIKP